MSCKRRAVPELSSTLHADWPQGVLPVPGCLLSGSEGTHELAEEKRQEGEEEAAAGTAAAGSEATAAIIAVMT